MHRVPYLIAVLESRNPTIRIRASPTLQVFSSETDMPEVAIPPYELGRLRQSPLQALPFQALRNPSAVTPENRLRQPPVFLRFGLLGPATSVSKQATSPLRRYPLVKMALSPWHDFFLVRFLHPPRIRCQRAPSRAAQAFYISKLSFRATRRLFTPNSCYTPSIGRIALPPIPSGTGRVTSSTGP